MTLSEEHRRKLSERNIGRKHTAAAKEATRAAKIGALNPQFGKPLSERQRAAFVRTGDAHVWFGRAHSAETKQLLAEQRQKAVWQVAIDGAPVKLWPSAKDAAAALGLRSPTLRWLAPSNGEPPPGSVALRRHFSHYQLGATTTPTQQNAPAIADGGNICAATGRQSHQQMRCRSPSLLTEGRLRRPAATPASLITEGPKPQRHHNTPAGGVARTAYAGIVWFPTPQQECF